MIRFTVTWDEDIEDPFIEAWVAGDSQMRATLTEIANWVDTQLADDPASKGEETDEPYTRVLAVPLTQSPAHVSVAYQVIAADRIVHVIRLTFRIDP